MKRVAEKLKRKLRSKKGNAASPASTHSQNENVSPPKEEDNMRLSMDAVGTGNAAAMAAKYGKASPVTPPSTPPEAQGGEEEEGSRRLSIDGDMINKVQKEQEALEKKPKPKSPLLDSSPVSTGKNGFGDEDTKSDDADDGTERRVDVNPEEIDIPITIGGNSRAGWSKSPKAGVKGGEGVRKANQDSYGAVAPFGNKNNVAYMSVFDGHGAEGRPSSQVVRDNIPKAILRSLRDSEPVDDEERPPIWDKSEMVRRYNAMKLAYEEAEELLQDEDSGIDHIFSGTTAVSSLIVGQLIFTAWAGDSRAIIARGSNGNVYPVDLTHDQKPGRTDEKKRVRAAGGRVTRWKKNIGPLRVWLPDDWIPGLAMTRSVGDTILTEFGVIPSPEVTVCEFSPKDQFMVLASDGVWEFMSSGEVASFVAKLKAAGSPPSAVANALVAESVGRWKKNEQVVDDTTAVIVYLNYTEKGQSGLGLERPQQLLESGELVPFSPRNDDEKP